MRGGCALPLSIAQALGAFGCGGGADGPPHASPDGGVHADAEAQDLGARPDQPLLDDAGADAGAGDAAAHDAGVTEPCTAFANPSASGTVAFGALDECSGLAASRAQPGLLYAHNDSGDSARFFALEGSGALRAEYTLAGATFRDLEDIAVGPGPLGASYVFLADTGDNDARSGGPNPRADVSVYRGTPAAPGNALSTGADFDVDGRRILVRTYGSVLLYEVGVDEAVGVALSRAATQVPAAGEPQGEAVAFVAGGYVTSSEGASQPLWFQAETCD